MVSQNKNKSLMTKTREVILSLGITGIFVAVLFIAPAGSLVKTVITKSPSAHAAGTCGSSAIFSASTNNWFTGPGSRCDAGTYSLTNIYSGYVLYKCGTTTCRLQKSCRVCVYGSGDPCPWSQDQSLYSPCGGSHISTYNCGDSSVAGCGDAFCRPSWDGGATGVSTPNAPSTSTLCKTGNSWSSPVDRGTYWNWVCTGPKGHTLTCGAPKTQYSVTPYADTGCSISPGDTEYPYAHSNSRTYTMGATSGYIFDGYSVDGGGTIGGASYTFTNVIANHTIRAKCHIISPVNASCGTNARQYNPGENSYAGSFCAPGTSSPASPAFPTYTTPTNWTCLGSSGGSNVTCVATKPRPTCSVKPTTGSNPLVSTVDYSGSGSVQSINMGDGTVYSGATIKPSGFSYTYKTAGNRTITITYPDMTCTANVSITNPKSSSGGEVAP